MAVDAPKKGRPSSATQKSRAKKKELPSATLTSQAEPETNWARREDSAAFKAASKFYKTVVKAYENKNEQVDNIEEYWNIVQCKPDSNQQYSGNSQVYIPAVRDALRARAKRVVKQLFPVNLKHVEGLSSDAKTPYTQLSLLEHYIRKLGLKDIVRSSLIAGDVTGQWNLLVDWTKTTRNIAKLVKRNPLVEEVDGEDVRDLEIEDPTSEYEDLEADEIVEEAPEVVDFATEDLAVIPPTCNDLQKAKAVSLRLRLSPDAVREMEDQGVFILPKGSDIEEFCTPDKKLDRKSRPQRQVHDAGIRTEGTNKHAIIFMVYMKLDLGGEHRESAIVYYAGEDEIIGIIRNPLWSGRVPIISQPVERTAGSFFGKSKVDPVKFTQWNLNDFFNMGQDSAMYSLLPIWAVDPLNAPQWQTLVMGLAAVWPVAPDNVKPLTQPQLWKDSALICDMMKRQIWESLDVNEMMMGKMPPGRKNAQIVGGMQQEQSTSINDDASRYEEVILNPLMEMLFELDQQFRTDDITIEQRGEIGVKASLEVIPVMQWGQKYFFRWAGTEYLMGMQRIQQQIAAMNVIKGIPPQQLNGRKFDATPILESLVENVFGPEMAPRILIDERNHYTIPPEIEDEMLHNGFANVTVHERDDDQRHLQSHMRAAAMNQDPLGLYREHMQAHMMQMQRKREMQMAPKPQGLPGGPGGGAGTAPPQGVAGSPRPGALPAPGRPAQQPAGAIQADQMADPMAGARG